MKCWAVVGIVDSNGAIDYRKVPENECLYNYCHDHLWPTKTHKRWRFIVSEWELDQSILSANNLTEEDQESIMTLMKKLFEAPNHVLEGEYWEALGRPRDEKWWRALRKFNRLSRPKKLAAIKGASRR